MPVSVFHEQTRQQSSRNRIPGRETEPFFRKGQSLGQRRFGNVQSQQSIGGHKVWIQFQDSSRLHQSFIILARRSQRNREANSHDQIEGIHFQRTPVLIDRLQGSS